MNVGTFRQFMLSRLFRASTPRRTAGRERVPDATTLLHFRHLYHRGAGFFAKVVELLLANGLFRAARVSMPR